MRWRGCAKAACRSRRWSCSRRIWRRFSCALRDAEHERRFCCPPDKGGSERFSRAGGLLFEKSKPYQGVEAVTSFRTLLYKETLRFWKVSVQTVAAPVLTALLYLVVFSHALRGRVPVYDGVPYTDFLVPGLVMMSVLQNAFANSSSSLVQSKITGNIVFVLLPPISYLEFFWAYVAASVVRGLAVGAAVLSVTAWFVDLRLQSPLCTAACALHSGGLYGASGW